MRKWTHRSDASVSRNSLAVWVTCTPLDVRQDQFRDSVSRNEEECLATRQNSCGMAF